MSSKVKMLRTVGGEFYIGEHELQDGEVQNDTITLKNIRVFSMQMTGNGQAGIAFIPVFPFSPSKRFETLTFTKDQYILVADEEEIDGQIVNGYKSNVTGIDLSASNANNLIIPGK